MNSNVQTRIADLSPEKLKLLAQRLKKGPREMALPVLRPAPERRYEPFPLTDVQEAYWIGRQSLFELGNVASHAYIEIPFRGLDLERLQRALDRLIDRHEMLRAIVLSDGRQQILESVPPYRILGKDLRGGSAAGVEAELEAVRGEMSHQVLSADRWPLFEIRASVLDGGRSIVHLSFDILIGDIWSFQLLQRELDELYADPEAELPRVEISFRDYVMAQVAFEEAPAYQRSVHYWRQRLPTLPPAPELPLAVSPGTLRAPRFQRRMATLDAASWSVIKGRANQLGITPSGLLLAAYGEVLSLWSKSPRFTINVTTFNRMPVHPGIDRVVGDFTSLTLVALDTALAGAFIERAQSVQQQLWRDLEHAHVSAVRLLRERTRSMQGASGAAMPVVFTSLLFNKAQEEPAPPPSGAVQVETGTSHNISQTPQVWLDFQVGEEHGVLVFNWDAVEDLFPAGLLDDMFAAFRGLLRSLAEDATAWARTSRAWLPGEQLRRRQEINATAAPLSTRRLHELFEEQARRDPARLAVVAAGARMTYGEIDRLAGRLARRLREAGARPNQLVAVVMEKGWEQVAAVLAILKSGAAYLPIDPDLPMERFRHLLAHAEVALALTQPWLDETLAWPPGVERFQVDAIDAEDAAPPLAPRQELDDLAYVIFTSGSTGLPKGVAIDHRGAVNTVLDINRRLAVGPEDRVLALSSLSFDLSVYDVFGLLAAGGCVVIPERTAQRAPDRWYELARDERVTLWNSVPALMQMLTEYTADRGAAPLSALRVVMMSGDWIPVALPDQVRELAPEARVISLGGATEASIWSVLYPIAEVDPAWKSIPYGRPMDNQTMEVLDSRLAPRPVWVPGDLYIGGVGLAQGYWRDEEKTRASFIVHPETGARLYRTGDLARWLPDGQLEFLGREDSQVKVQGFRIELGEIETALEQHADVRHGIALAVGTGNSRRLVACVVPNGPEVNAVERAALPATPPAITERGRIEAGRVPLAALGELLGSLLQYKPADAVLPKYRYPSAGSLYPVQTYVLVRPDRVEGLDGGAYYFHPRDNRLVQLTPGSAYLPAAWCDEEALAGAAFALVLVGNLAAIEPVYGDLGRPFCVLEAGSMSELLRGTASACGLALEPALPADLESLQERLSLGEEQVPVHLLLGGRLAWDDPDGETAPAHAAASPAPPVLHRDATPVLRKALADPLAELEHRLSEPGLRKTSPSLPAVQLPAPRDGEERARPYSERRSHREFLAALLPADLLTGLLAGVASADPRSEHDEIGLSALRVYVHVKAGRVAGLAAGYYRYDSAGAQPWVRLPGEGEIEASVHAAVNQRPFEQAAFSIFLVTDPAEAPAGLSPWALDGAALEAGAVSQRLMESAPGYGIGLCPIGTTEVDRIRRRFAWTAGEILIHSLIGGGISGGGGGRAAARLEEGGLATELREFLRRKLPEHMVPATLFTVSEVPLTGNGKVDRKALAARIDLPVQAPAVYAPPRTPGERRLAALWQEVLGIGKVGMEDNFFELGGSSVSLVRLHRRLQDLFNREMPLTQLFAHPTPRSLASLLDQEAPASVSLDEDRERAGMRRAARDRRRRPAQLTGSDEKNEVESHD
ncbi:MAG TPA: amino acid adenylation domain-containing protein [Thermoanaerobaculia bacterium]|jgi:amino acid adenylation domain-containing protein|nr:amino acid adenylation domain-containing protein [Thermoanaerobaculia bacterium]